MNHKNHSSDNIPPLRFPEFEGEWEKKKLGEVLTIGSGRDYKHLGEGEIPVFGTGGLMTKVDDYLYEGETVCIGRKGTIDKPMYFNGKLWTVDTLFYTHSFRSSTPKFVYNLFQRVNWKQHNEAGGVPSLSKSTIEQIELILPTTYEQTKIASFLTAVDEKIQALKKKHGLLEQYKKGVMQRLFCQHHGLNGSEDSTDQNGNQKSVKSLNPSHLRFRQKDGSDFPEWEVKKLGEIGEVKMCKRIFSEETSITGDIPFYKIGSFGKIADAYISRTLFDEYKSKYPFPKKGDILISASGTIGKLVIYNGEDAYYQDSNIVWLENDGKKVCNEFLYYILSNANFNTEGGTIQRLYNNILKSTKFNCPSIEEQTAIANFLSAIDEKINQTQMQIEKMEVWKKGLLQQLFV